MIEAGYDAFRKGDIEPLRGGFADDVELDLSGHPIPDFPNHGKGFDHLVGFVTTYLSGFYDYELEIRDLLDEDDKVVALLHDNARVGEGGATVERDLAHVWTISDGMVTRIQAFDDDAAALAAAGTGEAP